MNYENYMNRVAETAKATGLTEDSVNEIAGHLMHSENITTPGCLQDENKGLVFLRADLSNTAVMDIKCIAFPVMDDHTGNTVYATLDPRLELSKRVYADGRVDLLISVPASMTEPQPLPEYADVHDVPVPHTLPDLSKAYELLYDEPDNGTASVRVSDGQRLLLQGHAKRLNEFCFAIPADDCLFKRIGQDTKSWADRWTSFKRVTGLEVIFDDHPETFRSDENGLYGFRGFELAENRIAYLRDEDLTIPGLEAWNENLLNASLVFYAG